MTDADRIADLEEQVAYWKDLARGTPSLRGKLIATLQVPPQAAMIVAALYGAKGDVKTHQQLLSLIESNSEQWTEILRTQISRLRSKFPPGFIVTVKATKGELDGGYALSPEGMAYVRALDDA